MEWNRNSRMLASLVSIVLRFFSVCALCYNKHFIFLLWLIDKSLVPTGLDHCVFQSILNLETKFSGFSHRFWCLLAVFSWENYLTSLFLNFLICKMDLKIVYPHGPIVKIKWINIVLAWHGWMLSKYCLLLNNKISKYSIKLSKSWKYMRDTET